MGSTTTIRNGGSGKIAVKNLAGLAAEPKPLVSTRTGASFYRPELDALRFFAFFAVFLFHVLPDHVSKLPAIRNSVVKDVIVCLTSSLSFGVCLFFVLSAYLITTLLLREQHATNHVNLPDFYARRILRIWPLYLLALCLAFSACTLTRGFPGYKVIAAYLLFSGNLLGNFHLSVDIRPLEISHLWSISVEEQFYLVFPGVARVTKLRFLPLLCGVFTTAAIWGLIHLSHGNASKAEIWRSSFVQFMMFSAGVALAAYFENRPLPRFPVSGRAVILFFGAAACFSAQYFCRVGDDHLFVSARYAVIGYLLIMIGCSALLLAFLGFSGRIPSCLIHLGKISYGLYVFHRWALSLAAYVVTSFLHTPFERGTQGGPWALLKIVLAFIMTLGMAAFSYRFIEKPFLRIKKKFEVVSTRAV
jgi:peptidoglycan/LPS O-acetylase OafA/YrhL